MNANINVQYRENEIEKRNKEIPSAKLQSRSPNLGYTVGTLHLGQLDLQRSFRKKGKYF